MQRNLQYTVEDKENINIMNHSIPSLSNPRVPYIHLSPHWQDTNMKKINAQQCNYGRQSWKDTQRIQFYSQQQYTGQSFIPTKRVPIKKKSKQQQQKTSQPSHNSFARLLKEFNREYFLDIFVKLTKLSTYSLELHEGIDMNQQIREKIQEIDVMITQNYFQKQQQQLNGIVNILQQMRNNFSPSLSPAQSLIHTPQHKLKSTLSPQFIFSNLKQIQQKSQQPIKRFLSNSEKDSQLMYKVPPIDGVSSFNATPEKSLHIESYSQNEVDAQIEIIREIHGHWKFMSKFILEMLYMDVKRRGMADKEIGKYLQDVYRWYRAYRIELNSEKFAIWQELLNYLEQFHSKLQKIYNLWKN